MIELGTSGDTGSAAISAVRGLPMIDIIVLLPGGRCTKIQQLQMTTVHDANIHNFVGKYWICNIRKISKYTWLPLSMLVTAWFDEFSMPYFHQSVCLEMKNTFTNNQTARSISNFTCSWRFGIFKTIYNVVISSIFDFTI